MPDSEYYAETRWTVQDILGAAERAEIDMTPEQAREWLQRNAHVIQDRLVEVGWDVIDTLLSL